MRCACAVCSVGVDQWFSGVGGQTGQAEVVCSAIEACLFAHALSLFLDLV